MNATNKRESVAKLMKAWESKNAKRAMQGAGLTTMAVTLAACGGSDTTPFAQADVDAAVAAANAAAATAQAAAVAAEAAKVTAAETARDAAVAAQTAAEAARDAAIADKDAAVAAQTAAEAAKADAEAAQATAEAARDAALTAQATAEAARDAALTAQATAEAALAAQTTAITNAGFADLDALIDAYEALVAPQVVALTTTNGDNILGGPANDTFTGTSTTYQANDIINGGAGDDVLNLTLTGAMATATVSNVETINVDWDAFGTADINLTNVSGATVNVASTRVGYLGNMTVTAAGANTIVAGLNVDGTLDINGGTAVTFTATNGGTVTVDGTGVAASDVSATVVGGTTVSVGAANAFVATTVTGDANTTSITVASQNDGTISATGGASTTTMTLTNAETITAVGGAGTTTVTAQARAASTDASSATLSGDALATFTVDGTASTSDVATITTGAAAVTANVGVNTAVETVTINAAGGSTVTLNGTAQFTTMNVASTGAVTLVADGEISGTTVTDNTSGGLTVSYTQTAASDLDAVDGTIALAASSAHAMTLASGATVTVANAVALDAGQTFTVAGAGTADVLNFVVTGDKTTDIETTAVETTNVSTVLNTGDVDSIQTLAGVTAAGDVNITANSALTVATIAAGTNDVTVSAAGNVILGGTALTAGTLDMSGTTGNATVTQTAVAAMTAVGAAGNNTITFAGTTHDSSYTGSAGNDTVTLGTTQGTAVVSLGNGTNSVTAAALTIGTLNATGGDGVDTITVGAALTTGTAVAVTGGGNDVINFSDAAGVGNFTFNTGAGDDTINVLTVMAGANNITLTLGDGTDTLDLSNAANIDLSGQAMTVSGLDVIVINDSNDVVEASLLSGTSITVRGDGNVADLLGATETSDSQSLDFSNVVINNTLAQGLGGLAITTANGTNTVIGTSANDTIVGGTGVDTINGGAGNDTITGGAGNDVITAGEGQDTVDVTSGTDAVSFAESTAAVDTIIVNGGLATVSNFDFGGTATDDNIQIDLSGINGLITDVLAASDGSVMVAGAAAVQVINGATDLGVGAEEIIVIDGDIASASALETALEVGGTFQLTLNAGGTAMVAGVNDTFLVVYDDGVNSYLAAVNSAAGAAVGATFAAADLTVTNLVTFSGISDATDILAGDFAAIVA